jgi:hypothetical protein
MLKPFKEENQGLIDNFLELNQKLEDVMFKAQYQQVGLLNNVKLSIAYKNATRAFAELPRVEQDSLIDQGLQGYAFLLEEKA